MQPRGSGYLQQRISSGRSVRAPVHSTVFLEQIGSQVTGSRWLQSVFLWGCAPSKRSFRYVAAAADQPLPNWVTFNRQALQGVSLGLPGYASVLDPTGPRANWVPQSEHRGEPVGTAQPQIHTMPPLPMYSTLPLSQHPDPGLNCWAQHLARPRRDPGVRLRSGPPLESLDDRP
ncbi:hypothetical protein NDU88_001351 [Pleurodeles waltl]|uniref:Uncharacterized protein n=1 Tax=Pleurodeles waltl TaxID=8319 RepID=A0AAV7TI26_PLEWA|nr:hypothetical protein NDU88_001351 [Pleurodeles waltl]